MPNTEVLKLLITLRSQVNEVLGQEVRQEFHEEKEVPKLLLLRVLFDLERKSITGKLALNQI